MISTRELSASQSAIARCDADNFAVAELAAAGVASPSSDARWLIDHAERTGADLEELVARRASREPLQHILGTAAFRHLELEVGPGVFVPRPETELLVESVLSAAHLIAAAGQAPIIADLCAGSGAIGLSVASELGRPAIVHLVESDPTAYAWLRRNTEAVNFAAVHAERSVAGDCLTYLADLGDALPELVGRVDIVAANPPYLPEGTSLDAETARFDPPIALWAGPDGLAVIRRVIAVATRLLKPGGLLVAEHDSSHDLRPLLANGWRDVQAHDDLTGRPRFTTAVKA